MERDWTKIALALDDDLDSGPAEQTVRFGVGGAEYEIDLSKKNAKTFPTALTPFVELGRRAGLGSRRLWAEPSTARQRGGGIRAWAKGQGIAMSDRGRAATIVEQHEAATRQHPPYFPARDERVGMLHRAREADRSPPRHEWQSRLTPRAPPTERPVLAHAPGGVRHRGRADGRSPAG
jgi:hypothetical protein